MSHDNSSPGWWDQKRGEAPEDAAPNTITYNNPIQSHHPQQHQYRGGYKRRGDSSGRGNHTYRKDHGRGGFKSHRFEPRGKRPEPSPRETLASARKRLDEAEEDYEEARVKLDKKEKAEHTVRVLELLCSERFSGVLDEAEKEGLHIDTESLGAATGFLKLFIESKFSSAVTNHVSSETELGRAKRALSRVEERTGHKRKSASPPPSPAREADPAKSPMRHRYTEADIADDDDSDKDWA